MKRMICLECGYNFDFTKSKECPICKNDDEKYLLKSIELEEYPINKLGICDDEELRKAVKSLLEEKTHSSAYIKVCGRELERTGYMYLGLALEEIALRKQNIETDLLECYGIKNDIRLNLNNILKRAEADVIHANKIAELAKDKKNDEVYNLLHELAKHEASNLAALNGVLLKYIKETKCN